MDIEAGQDGAGVQPTIVVGVVGSVGLRCVLHGCGPVTVVRSPKSADVQP